MKLEHINARLTPGSSQKPADSGKSDSDSSDAELNPVEKAKIYYTNMYRYVCMLLKPHEVEVLERQVNNKERYPEQRDVVKYLVAIIDSFQDGNHEFFHEQLCAYNQIQNQLHALNANSLAMNDDDVAYKTIAEAMLQGASSISDVYRVYKLVVVPQLMLLRGIDTINNQHNKQIDDEFMHLYENNDISGMKALIKSMSDLIKKYESFSIQQKIRSVQREIHQLRNSIFKDDSNRALLIDLMESNLETILYDGTLSCAERIKRFDAAMIKVKHEVDKEIRKPVYNPDQKSISWQTVPSTKKPSTGSEVAKVSTPSPIKK